MSTISQVIPPGLTDTYDIKAPSIPMGQVDSTSTSTAFTATVDGITTLYNGVCVWLVNDVVDSASGCTLNINELGAKPIYISTSTSSRVTTHFTKSTTNLFIYNSTRVENGCWDYVIGYNSNTTYTAGNHLTLSSNLFSLSSYCKTITDWNSATTNGWYMGSNVANAPTTDWWFGRVIAHNAKYCLQEVWNFNNFVSSTDARYIPHKIRWFKNSTWGDWADFSIYHVGANNRTVMSNGNGLILTTPTTNAWAMGLMYNNTSETQIGFIGAYGSAGDTLSRFDIGTSFGVPWLRIEKGYVTIYDNDISGPTLTLRDRIGVGGYLKYSVISSDLADKTRTVIKCLPHNTSGVGVFFGHSTGGLTVVGAGESISVFESTILSADKNPYNLPPPADPTPTWTCGTENLVNIADSDIYFISGAGNLSTSAYTDWTDLKTAIFDSSGNFRPSINNKGSIGTSSYKWSNIYATNLSGKLYTTATNPSSETLYYVPFISGATSGNYDQLVNNGFGYRSREGSTSQNGFSVGIFGNGTVSGTAGNKYGVVRIYGTGAYYSQIKTNAASSDKTVSMPNMAGNFLILNKNSTSYWGLYDGDASMANWIRTTTNGFLPVASGSLDSPHSALGTPTWAFNSAYIADINSKYLRVKSSSDTCTMLYNSTTQSLDFIFS